MLRVLFLAHPERRERDDTDGADARERFVVGRRAGIERDVLRLHLRRVRDGEAVLRVGERSRTRSSSSRRARVRRVLRERGERVERAAPVRREAFSLRARCAKNASPNFTPCSLSSCNFSECLSRSSKFSLPIFVQVCRGVGEGH